MWNTHLKSRTLIKKLDHADDYDDDDIDNANYHKKTSPSSPSSSSNSLASPYNSNQLLNIGDQGLLIKDDQDCQGSSTHEAFNYVEVLAENKQDEHIPPTTNYVPPTEFASSSSSSISSYASYPSQLDYNSPHNAACEVNYNQGFNSDDQVIELECTDIDFWDMLDNVDPKLEHSNESQTTITTTDECGMWLRYLGNELLDLNHQSTTTTADQNHPHEKDVAAAQLGTDEQMLRPEMDQGSCCFQNVALSTSEFWDL